MTIAGRTFTVVQAAAPCTVVLSATGAAFSSAGGSSNVTATASSTNCVVFSSSNNSWLSITAGSSLVGTGKVSYTVAPNTNTSQRSGTLNIGDKISSASGTTITSSESSSDILSPSVMTEMIFPFRAFISCILLSILS